MKSRRIRRVLNTLDIGCAIVAPFAAFMLRQWLEDARSIDPAFLYYALSSAAASIALLRWTGVSRAVWAFFNIQDAARAARAIAMAVAIGALVGFSQDRLDSMARSVPFLHVILQTAAFVGLRLLAQKFLNPSDAKRPKRALGVLVVGCNAVADTYVRAAGALSDGTLEVVGILSDDPSLVGNTLRGKRIISTVMHAEEAVSTLKVHGIEVSRLVLTVPMEDLSEAEVGGLTRLSQNNGVTLLPIYRLFRDVTQHEPDEEFDVSEAAEDSVLPGRYWPVKRALDICAAGLICLLLFPVFLLVAAAATFDVGAPLIFWQSRVGRHGRHFLVYKFRTMGAPKGPDGHAIPDELRTSRIGHFLRRTRLDELPQLINILFGDMSFIGPRPLLPIDQPTRMAARLAVRPGLSGWAQVNGGKLVNPEEKRALDLWYVAHASFPVDINIAWLTLLMFVRGDVRKEAAITHAVTWLAEREAAIEIDDADTWPGDAVTGAST